MDSKIITREIRRFVWPRLKVKGFAHFSGRSAWRHSVLKIDVINFQSFNSYLAGGVGCTTYSFALNLGCYFLTIPWHYPRPIRQKNSFLLPQEFECHFRLHSNKAIWQPELKRESIWLIKENGEYLPEAIEDAIVAIERNGIPWFDNLANYELVFEQLQREDNLWEIGTKSSPIRHYLTGYVALACGKEAIAVDHLQAALDSGCFKQVESQLQERLRELSGFGSKPENALSQLSAPAPSPAWPAAHQTSRSDPH